MLGRDLVGRIEGFRRQNMQFDPVCAAGTASTTPTADYAAAGRTTKAAMTWKATIH
jgi:hypothetical protein